eukprot:scaffold174736_cov39-Tisochrysis_lutea.AAC.1
MEPDVSAFEARQKSENETFAANIAAKRAAAKSRRLSQPTLLGGVMVPANDSLSSASAASSHVSLNAGIESAQSDDTLEHTLLAGKNCD